MEDHQLFAGGQHGKFHPDKIHAFAPIQRHGIFFPDTYHIGVAFYLGGLTVFGDVIIRYDDKIFGGRFDFLCKSF